ncbi:MAG TPA: hypothetical protein VGW30_04490 [Gaiellaceae bacterium]|nr:hypothetical protein [Gaiellaceae bacterium]
MRLAVVVFLAALVALPLAAEAAQSPTRWAVTLNGRVVEEHTYGDARREAECIVRRSGRTTREWRVASTRPTVISVARSNSRARYRPARLLRVRLVASAGRGSWMEMRQCLGEEIRTSSGTCGTSTQRAWIRPAFAWGGANRIHFRTRSGAPPLRLCGFDWTVTSKDSWLSVAPGQVDEEVLISGSRRRVVARADVSRVTMLPFNPPPGSTQQDLRVVWTLVFRRLP